jgi:DNA repair protein RadD
VYAEPDLLDDGSVTYDASLFPPPRTFQGPAHEALQQGAREGHKRQMLMAPTGSGKTYLGLRACSQALMKGRRAMFLADRLTLIDQTSSTADRYGLQAHGIIQANHWRTNPNLPFQIGSLQTVARRKAWPEHLDLLVVDEAHTRYPSLFEFLETFKGHVIGLSATPFTRGLSKVYTNLVNATTMAALVDEGTLVPLRVFECVRANMAKAATDSDGEWTAEAASERGLSIVGDVVDEWQQYAGDRKTIGFGATIAHAEALCRKFNERGIMASVFCADTLPSERESILKEYRKPDSVIRVLLSVEALAKGFDVPDVGCIIDARPLRKGLSTFVQMIGRGLRSSPETGKTDCILLDHSGNIRRFANDFSDLYFNGLDKLAEGKTLDSVGREEPEEREVVKCPRCGYRPMGKRCIGCGFAFAKAAEIEHEIGAGMREVVIGKTRVATDRTHLFNQIVTWCRTRGAPTPEQVVTKARGLYKDLLGGWPPEYMDVSRAPDVPVSRELHGQLMRKMLAFYKGGGGRARR